MKKKKTMKKNECSDHGKVHKAVETVKAKTGQGIKYVQENPLKSAGIAALAAAGIGFIIGRLSNRCKK